MNDVAVSLDGKVVIPRGVVTRIVGDSTVLLNSQSGRYFTLDDIGSRAWAQLTSSPTIRVAIERLIAEFAADPEQLTGDLEELIESLASRGLIEVRPV